MPISSSKLYKSGDLVRYLPDGKMMYLGRKDTMVKVRGQKLEVEEVESVIRRTLGGSSQVAVDLVELHSSGPRLVAFLSFSDNRHSNENTDDRGSGMLRSSAVPDEKMSTIIAQVRSHLNETLPGYMVPRMFIPLAMLPVNSNGKLDRNMLKEYARILPTSELFKYTESGTNEEVLTEIPHDDTVALEVSAILDNILRGPDSTGDNPLK
jgi:acyl-coenzyme A synthetase/AMP-(fatty) acid ligase